MLGNRKSSINSNYCINDILVYYADIKFYEIQDVCLTTKGNSMDEDPTSSTDNHIRCTIKATFWTKTQQVAFSFFSAFSSALTLHKHGGVCGCKKKKKRETRFLLPLNIFFSLRTFCDHLLYQHHNQTRRSLSLEILAQN